MIEAIQLTKHFGPTKSLNGVSFSVEKGEILGFLGPNGAGKSTTMKLLVGLMRPTAGSARIAGLDVQSQGEAVRRLLGYLPEAAPLYADMTLQSYLEFMAGLKGLNAREVKREMERTTGLVQLTKERPRLLRNLSKGTRQRAAIAQALLGNPPVLILDEPTVGLDPSQINEVRQLVRSLRGECTVVLSTHILPEVEMTCSRLLIIGGGRVLASGTPAELLSSIPAEGLVRARASEEAFRGAMDSVLAGKWRFSREDGVCEARFTPPAEELRPAIARALAQAGADLLDLHLTQPRLEDVFLRVISGGRS
jgi:ABC-2 type transport system ATP-binding protein